MFDLTIYPISLAAGREQHTLPGLLVASAPRKAARMRAQDILLVQLTLINAAPGADGGGEAFSQAQQHEMLQRLSETYFGFSGSVTAGMRALSARLNDFLLQRNLKSSNAGQTVGLLNMAVQHGSSLMIAHAGPTHTFVLGKNTVQHFDDSLPAGGAGRGLGLSKQALPRFYQAALEPGDLLLFCENPPAGWTVAALANSTALHFDLLRRRLLSDAGMDLRAALVRFQSGKGQISYWRPSERASERRAPAQPAVTESAPAPETAHDPVAPEADAFQADAFKAAASQAAALNAPISDPVALTAAELSIEEPPFTQSEPAQDDLADIPDLSAAPQDADASTGAAASTGAQRINDLADLPADFSGEAQAFPPEWAEPGAQAGEVGAPSAPEQASPPVGVFLGGETNLAGAAPEPLPRPRLHREMRPAELAGAPNPDAAPAAAGSRRAGRQARQSVRPMAKPRKPAGPPPGDALRKRLAAWGLNIRAAWNRSAPRRSRFGGAVSGAVHQAIPRRVDAHGREVPLLSFNLSSGAMLAIAIFVPLLVVSVATAVYFQSGRTEQFEAVFLQAQQYAQQAAAQEDPVAQRATWAHTVDLIDRAEQFASTDESRTLRKQAQDMLDSLDGLMRLDFRPAGSAFTAGVNITRIAPTLNDVYLLDSSQGRILRMFRTASGYEIDGQFTCGPGQAGAVVIGSLIDLAALPVNNALDATVAGIDASGNLVYCAPNLEGFINMTLPAPDAGWGKITAIRLYADKLYVLDPGGNAVYYYDGENSQFNNKPHFYFDTNIPKMGDVIDLAVDQEFLYLLHADGQMTICEGGGYSLASASCSDAPYGDSRAGFEPSPLFFKDAHFLQIQTTQPPDPSIFALDAANQSIYHLSLRRLNLQRQYRPLLSTDFPLPDGPATAFGVAPNRRLLMAVGNQVFFATIP